MKKILSGTTALIAAVGFASAAFAADAPAAAPVLGCAAAGGGYFAIPGGDGTCLRVYGLARTDVQVNPAQTRANSSGFALMMGSAKFATKTPSDYGTVFSYHEFRLRARSNAGSSTSTPVYNSSTTGYNSAQFTPQLYQSYVQFTGLTVGRHTTFTTLYSDLQHSGSKFKATDFAMAGGGGDHPYELLGISNGASDNKVNLINYTVEAIPGLFFAAGIEDPSDVRGNILLVNNAKTGVSGDTLSSTGGITAGTAGAITSVKSSSDAGATIGTGNGYGGVNVPDMVLSVRNDGTWGNIMASVVAHQVNTTTASAANTGYTGAVTSSLWGYAVNTNAVIAVPGLGNGGTDVVNVAAGYEAGAMKYVFQGGSNWATTLTNNTRGGAALGSGVANLRAADAYIDTSTGVMTLTKGYAGSIGAVHFFTPTISGDAVASYGKVTSGSGAYDATMITGTVGVTWRPINNLFFIAEGNIVRLDNPAYNTANGSSKFALGNTNYIGNFRVEKDF